MNPISRHKNTVALAVVLLLQLLALAVQVKRQTAEGPVRVIRLLTVETVGAFERVLLHGGQGVRGVWSNYIDLRNVRRENLRLESETAQMRLQRAKQQEEIRQAHRILALLAFKQHWIDTTVAAQVIGTSGTETSRLIYVDKGIKDGIRPDMAVITPDGVVGKVLAVYGETSQVLMMNDITSGVGAILVKSRLQGIVKGTPTGEVQLKFIMSDESVQAGEALVTSGGDRVFPKGLPVGTVAKVSPGHDLFLDIRVKPAVDLNRLEEVLVITEQKPRAVDTTDLGPIRASDILAEHLPSVPTPAPAETATDTPNKTTAPNGTVPKSAAPAASPKAATTASKPAASPEASAPAKAGTQAGTASQAHRSVSTGSKEAGSKQAPAKAAASAATPRRAVSAPDRAPSKPVEAGETSRP